MITKYPEAVLMALPGHLLGPAVVLVIFATLKQVHITEQDVTASSATGVRVANAFVKDVSKVDAIAKGSACGLGMEGVDRQSFLQDASVQKETECIGT